MSIGDELRRLASEFADQTENRISAIEAELAKIDARKAELVAERDAAGRAQERLLEFAAAGISERPCPRCWVNDEVWVPLAAIPSDGPDDRFRCRTCGITYDVPA